MDLPVEFPSNPGDQATSVAHEAIGLSAAAGVGASSHSPVLLQQRDPGRDRTQPRSGLCKSRCDRALARSGGQHLQHPQHGWPCLPPLGTADAKPV